MSSAADAIDELLSPEGWPYASSLPRTPADPGRFHALFGRDSLVVSLQLLPQRPDVARGTLRALAALQGTADDPQIDEEPGKIVHEHRPVAPERFRAMGWPLRDGELRYYGSADSTPWFLVVLATTRDAGLAGELERHWRAAGDWLLRALERGGGLLRHGPRHHRGGLRQQGWRDTTDPLAPETHGAGIIHADGGVPPPPLADADSQAVALAGLRALARLSGEPGHAQAADGLAASIEAWFGPRVMAIDGDDREVLGAGSQLGWLLWAGALSGIPAADAAERLCRPDLLTPWGVRTLAADEPRFDPRSYHRGSVWPFDSWISFGGLRAAGREAEAERIRAGVLEAIERIGGAPELYAVESGAPRPLPFANRVQAWTVGARAALESGWDASDVRRGAPREGLPNALAGYQEGEEEQMPIDRRQDAAGPGNKGAAWPR